MALTKAQQAQRDASGLIREGKGYIFTVEVEYDEGGSDDPYQLAVVLNQESREPGMYSCCIDVETASEEEYGSVDAAIKRLRKTWGIEGFIRVTNNF